MSIHIDYNALREDSTAGQRITADLLKKAKGLFGGSARRELVRLFDRQMRLMAAEIAQRQANPQVLYEAGRSGLMEAVRLYRIGETLENFRSFAIPIIRQRMVHAKSKGA
jgi:DNA-directed RNA polymerase specialized sigma subunit